MSGMRIVHHGGMCCGIKTIHCLGTDPDGFQGFNGDVEGKEPEITGFNPVQEDQFSEPVNLHDDDDYVGADVSYEVVNSWTNIFDGKAPEEYPRERLKRYLEWIAKKRPSHMVEICLQMSGFGKQLVWIPILEEHGFKKMTEFYNSNSGHMVGVFHLVLFEGKVMK